jgi:hypothetical protein
MGWSYCGQDENGRDIGYGISATCDHPDCDKKIDRGLSYCCGDMHGGELYKENDGYASCGGYFCEKHLTTWSGPEEVHQVCHACDERLETERQVLGDGDCMEEAWEKLAAMQKASAEKRCKQPC